ncbi:Flavin reductase like domain protein [compost metagenome]
MQKQYNLQDILLFDQRYRATFINSLGGFKSLVLVGTMGNNDKTNLAPFSSFVHLGANPPLFALIIRPDSVERHTLENIRSREEFTVNHVREDFYMQAHQCSARYPREQSEFDATGLIQEQLDGFSAPFVKQSIIKIGARFLREIEIKENGTVMLIAQIERVILPADCLEKDGFVDIEKARTVTCSGLDSYHSTHRIGRLCYAKPELQTRQIDQF